jgi:hypothetical protein
VAHHARGCERGIDITREQLAAVNMTRRAFHGDCSYTINPSLAQSRVLAATGEPLWRARCEVVVTHQGTRIGGKLRQTYALQVVGRCPPMHHPHHQTATRPENAGAAEADEGDHRLAEWKPAELLAYFDEPTTNATPKACWRHPAPSPPSGRVILSRRAPPSVSRSHRADDWLPGNLGVRSSIAVWAGSNDGSGCRPRRTHLVRQRRRLSLTLSGR